MILSKKKTIFLHIVKIMNFYLFIKTIRMENKNNKKTVCYHKIIVNLYISYKLIYEYTEFWDVGIIIVNRLL